MKITFSKSFREFLEQQKSSCAISRLLLSINNGGVYNLLFNYETINYITFRKDGLISYLPFGKEHLTNDDGTWQKKNRQDGKPGKVIMQLFSDKAKKILKPSLFENFGNKYKGYFQDYNIELLHSSDVKRIYNMDTIEGGASLQGSCMQGKDSDYLDIYENCDKLQIAVIIKDNLLLGRALVWDIGAGQKFIDRFYVGADYLYETFVNYAVANNMYYKQNYKSFDDKKALINPVTKEMEYKTIKIYTDTDFDYYPYIDTLHYGGDGYLTNSSTDYKYEYCCTDGGRDGDEDNHEDESYDELNNCYISNDDAVWIDAGERKYRDRCTHIDNCIQVDGSWYHENDCNIVRVGRDWYTIDSEDICCVNDEYVLIDDAVYSEEEGEYILMEDAVEIDGEWYNEDSDSIIEVDGTWYLKTSDDICCIDGSYYEVNSDEVVLNEETGEYELKEEENQLQTSLEL